MYIYGKNYIIYTVMKGNVYSMNSKTYIVVVLGIVLAKLVGFSRDIFFANFYGTGTLADIYFQIFSIVNLIFTGIGVALQTRVIMNLNKEENSTEERKKAYVSSFLKRAVLYLSIATLALYVLAKPLTRILLPNISGDDFSLALRLTCIMLPSFIFVSVAYIISGILQNSRVFFIPSIVSLPYNIIIIASLFIPGVTIEQIGIATTFGWFLHIVIQLPHFYKKGYRFLYRTEKREKSNTSSAGLKNTLSIAFIFISNLMFQLCFIIDKASVSGNEGMTSALNYASNLFVTISSVFVVAMSSVVFPAISKNYEEGKIEYVRELIGYIIIVMFAVFVPFLLVVSLFGEQIIALVYERGAFTSESTVMTALAFTVYSLGILGYLAQELINKVMYLASKYAFTVIGTAVVVILKFILDYLFVPELGAGFAAVSTTVLLTVYAIAAFIMLKKIIGNYISKSVITGVAKVLICGAAALAVYFIMRIFVPDIVRTKEIAFVIPIVICGITYIGTAFVLGLHKVLLRGAGHKSAQ